MGAQGSVGPRHVSRRILLLAGGIVIVIVALIAFDPQVAHASTLQRHSALVQRAADAGRTAEQHDAIDRDGIGIVSHRGAAAIAPENTMAAMRIAFERGVDFVELDVQLTADRVPVLLHDDTVNRTTNGGGNIANWVLDELQTLDAGSWFDADYAGEPIPTFSEFADELAPTNSRALVELKGEWNADDVEGLLGDLRVRHLVNRVALQSFEIETLEVLAEVGPEFARVMLTREWDEAALELAVDLQASAVGARAALYDARPELIELAQRIGIGTLVYTLNSEKRWIEADELGLDLVITDDPVPFEAWRDAWMAEARAAAEAAELAEAAEAAARAAVAPAPDRVTPA